MTEAEADRPDFTDEDAASILGKYVLIGVTYEDSSGNMLEQAQMHGVIERADSFGIVVELRGKHAGTSWRMPPDMRAISAAPAGSYRLRETGEIVENPDLLAEWTITKPTTEH
jgi:hypothetical protein